MNAVAPKTASPVSSPSQLIAPSVDGTGAFWAGTDAVGGKFASGGGGGSTTSKGPGLSHPGHAGAAVLISRPQSGQGMSGIVDKCGEASRHHETIAGARTERALERPRRPSLAAKLCPTLREVSGGHLIFEKGHVTSANEPLSSGVSAKAILGVDVAAHRADASAPQQPAYAHIREIGA